MKAFLLRRCAIGTGLPRRAPQRGFPAMLAMALCAACLRSVAGTEPFFVPLTASAPITPANSRAERQQPFRAPAGVSMTRLTSLDQIEAHVRQSTQRVPGLGVSASMFDMLAFSDDGRYLFIPHETLYGAGVSRYDTDSGLVDLLLVGNQEGRNGDWSRDFGSFDPARITPNHTLWLAEEWSGLGRVVELLSPFAPAPADPRADRRGGWRVLPTLARVSHEGIGFSRAQPDRVIYFVDEDRSGSIYKLVLARPGDYLAGGQTFALAISAFSAGGGDAGQHWDSQPNRALPRTGGAHWVPITDASGGDLADVTNPFDNSETESTRPGRVAADDVGATPYGRPEDVEVGTLANGHEVLYFTATAEQVVYAVEMTSAATATVREFASEAATPKNLGFAATRAVLNAPDNLAQDALGNIYVLEDAPGDSAVGGDIWFIRDVDGDGVAESLDHFMSLRVEGAEATGMVFHPTQPAQFAISVQHPASTDLQVVPGGIGDAVWMLELNGQGLDPAYLERLNKRP